MGSSTFNPGPTLEQRLSPSIATHQDLTDSIMQALRVALVGIVQPDGFDPGPPAYVTVQVAVKEAFQYSQASSVDDPINLVLKYVIVPLPGVLAKVPLFIPGAGVWSLTFPIKEGDECLLVFTDTELDTWYQSGGNPPVTPVDGSRRHSLSDCIALFGMRSTPRGLENYSADSAQLRNDDSTVVIDLADSGITITSPKVTVNCTGDVDVNCDNATVTASGNVDISGETVSITGSSGVTIDGAGATKIDGKTFLSHLHSGVSTGAGDTGPVV